jgi:hypothetical protein
MFSRKQGGGGGTPMPAIPVKAGSQKKRVLNVEVLDAKNLIPSAKNGTSDPYITLALRNFSGTEIKTESFKTTQKTGTISPTFNEKFVFGDNSFLFFLAIIFLMINFISLCRNYL